MYKYHLLASYDSENGFGGLFGSFKKLKEVPNVTDEISNGFTNLFNKIGDTSKLSAWSGQFDLLARSCKVTDKSFIDFLKTTQKSGTVYKTSKEAIAGYQTYLKSTNTALDLTSIKTKALSISMKLLSSIGWTAIFTLASSAIGKCVEGISNLIHANERAREKSEELTNTYNEQKESLDNQLSKYKELKERLSDESLTTEQVKNIKNDLLDVQKKITSSYGDEADGIDLVNGKYEEQIGLLDELSVKRAEEYTATNRRGYEADLEYLNNTKFMKSNDNLRISPFSGMSLTDELRQYLEQRDDILLRTSKYSGTGEKISLGNFGISLTEMNMEDAYNALVELYDDIGKRFSNSKEAENLQLAISDVINNSFDKAKIDAAKQRINDYVEAQVVSNDKLRKIYQDSISAVDEYNNALLTGDEKTIAIARMKVDNQKRFAYQNQDLVEGSYAVFEDVFNLMNEMSAKSENVGDGFDKVVSSLTFTDDQTKAINQYKSDLKAIKSAFQDIKNVDITDFMATFSDYNWTPYQDGAKSLTQVLHELANKSLAEVKSSVSGLDSEFLKLYSDVFSITNSFKETTESIDELDAVLTKVRDGQALSSSELAKLINKYGDLSGAVLTVADGYSIEESALISLLNKKISESNTFISTEIEQTEKTIDAIRMRIEAYQTEADALDELARKYDKSVGSIGEYIDKYGEGSAYDTFGASAVIEYQSTQQDLPSIYENQLKKLESIKSKYKKQEEDSSKSSSSKSVKDDLEDRYNAEKDLLDIKLRAGQISEAKYYEKLRAINNSYFKDKKDYYVKWANTELDIQENLYDLEKSSLDKSLNDSISSYEKYLSTLQDKLSSLKDNQSDYDSAVSTVDKYYSDQIELINEQKKSVEDSYNLQIKAIDNVINAKEKENEAQQRQIDLQQKQYALEQARNNKTNRIYKKGLGFDNYEADTDAIIKAQNELDKARYDNEISSLRDAKKSLEDAKSSALESFEAQIESIETVQKKFNKIFEDINDVANIELAKKIFGDNWQEMATDGSLLDNIGNIVADYQELQQTIADTESAIKLQEENIEKLQDLETEWQEADESIVSHISSITESLGNSVTTENSMYSDKLSNLQTFADRYNQILSTIGNVPTALPSLGDGNSSGTVVKTVTKHDGIRSGLVGSSSSKQGDIIKLLAGDGLKSDEIYAKLLKNEVVLTQSQQNNLINRFSDTIKIPAYENFVTKSSENGKTVSVNVPQININNPDNYEQIVSEIKRELPNDLAQIIASRY